MQVRARIKNFPMSGKKVRRIVGFLRGKNAEEAKQQLFFLDGKAGGFLFKLLDSAIANGVNNLGFDKNNLYIEEIKVDQAQPLKRWMPRSHGKAFSILKRHCHVEIILNEREEGKNRVEVKRKKAKTISYQELKKITEQADKILEKQEQKKSKERKNKDLKTKSLPTGAIRKMFRRKSI